MLNILSFDGGPAPLLHAQLLERVETHLRESGSKSLLSQVDLFAGTSDGALLALFLAMKIGEHPEAAELDEAQLFRECIEFMDGYSKAFQLESKEWCLPYLLAQMGEFLDKDLPPWQHQPWRLLGLGTAAVKRLWKSRLYGLPLDLWTYRKFIIGKAPLCSDQGLREFLQGVFGNRTLGDLKRQVVALSFDTLNWAPRVFRNFADMSDPAEVAALQVDLTCPIVEVALSTTSLPLLLPIHDGRGLGGKARAHLDGFFVANNATMSAVSLALKHTLLPKLPPGRNPLDELRVLSLGVSQTIEEANLENRGGVLATLVQLLSKARDMRFYPPITDDKKREAYVASEEARRQVQATTETEPLKELDWGWFHFIWHPTFTLELLIHGLNEEVSQQNARMLGERGYHRYNLRINLLRTVFAILFLRREVSQTDLPWNARRCFSEPGLEAELPLSRDEEVNQARTQALLSWVKKHWFKEDGKNGSTQAA